MYKIITLLFILILMTSCSSINRHIKHAERYTQNNQINKAIEEYKKVLSIDKDNYKANAALGVLLCHYMNLYEDALPYLENAYLHSPKDTSIDVIYGLAKSYQFFGQCDKALQMLNKLNDVVATEEDDKEFQMDIKKRKDDCHYVLQHQNETQSTIKVVNMGKTINTSAPEYVPTYLNNQLYFTSKRKDSDKEKFNDWDGKYFEAIYTARLKNGSPEKVDYLYIPTISKKIKPNSNRSVISISGNKKYLFIFDNTKITQIAIDSISTQKDKPLPKTINMGYYQSHAFLTKDGQKLYFTSEAENSLGGLDIYVSRKNADGTWSAPENLGRPVNTEYDEDAPFLSDDEKTLYFASKGHPGFGNYDIYKSEWTGTHWSEPINLGRPINSYGHDIYYVEDSSKTNVYFSSYRPGGYGDMDIYKILYLDKFKDIPISDLKIGEIIAQKKNDSLYHLTPHIPAPYEQYYPSWKIKNQSVPDPETQLIIPYGQKEKVYYEALLVCDTCLNPIKIRLEKTIENILPAVASTTVAPKPEINTLPKGELSDPIAASLGFDTSAIYFDFNKSTIKEEYTSLLNKTIELLNQYHFSVKIEGYSDLYGPPRVRRRISYERAKSVYKYLIHHGLSKKQVIEYKGKGALNYCEEEDLEKCPDGIHSRNRKAKIRILNLD